MTTTVYIIDDSLTHTAYAVDAEESIHLYNGKGEFRYCLTRGEFFGSDYDFYEIEGAAADAFLREKAGW